MSCADHIIPWIRVSDTHAFGEHAKYEDRRIVYAEDSKIPRELKLVRQRKQSNGRRDMTPVGSYDDAGELVKEYPSQAQAARENGVDQQSIYKAIVAKHRCCGYYWRKLEDV